jgi:transcriptional regulator with XRE-family HTH domain
MAEQGLTNAALAKNAGVSPSLIDKLRNNERRPSPEMCEKIESALGVRVWSSNTIFLGRAAAVEFERRVLSISELEGIDADASRVLAAERFPALFAKAFPSLPTPVLHNQTK